MRIQYVTNPPETSSKEEADILSRVQARRGPRGLIPLDRALLHSFPIADGWNSFFGAIRTQTSLSGVIRELIMCRVAVINQAWFEWDHHSPLLKEAGFSDEALNVVKDRDAHMTLDDKVERGIFTPQQAAVLKYTDSMTKTVLVPDEVFQQVKEYFNEKEVVEITATVAGYNCVSRFLVALDVGEKNEH